ncbi:MAG TPA: ribokinase, partial [Clostridia bacterium]|nr:ribokinase [Clostridia bacterium]
ALLGTMGRDPIDLTHIQTMKDVPTGIASITVDRQGHNRITVVPGANGTFTKEDIESLRPLIARSNVLLLQLEIPLEAVETAIRIAYEEGVFCVLNPAPAMILPNSFYQYVDLMTPNESELSLLSGRPTADRAQWLEAGQALVASGLATLIVTLGQHGSLAMNNKGSAHFPAYRVRMLDSTAAGDSFNGALASQIDRMIGQRGDSTVRFSPSIDDLAPAIDYATKAAAMSVTRSGAQPSIPLSEEIERFDAWFASHRL